jgi:hypothetical protein
MTDLRDDELVLMHNAETDGWFECPAAAVESWRARGWEVADPDERPADPNPVVEELAAFQAESAARAAEAAKPAKKAAKSTAPAPSGDEEKE